MEADLARIDATLHAGLNEVRSDIARLEGQLEARVSLQAQHETVARLHDRIDSIAAGLEDVKHAAQTAQRWSIAVLISVLGAVVATLYAGVPG